LTTIAAFCSHTGAQGGYGGGEAFTFATLHVLNRYYDLEVFTRAQFPAFYHAGEYGIDLSNLKWQAMPRNFNWSKYDVQINMAHDVIAPPHARRNILFVLFPQYPEWDVSGYDTIVTISEFSKLWIKRYWGREATVVYPPVHIKDLVPLEKKKSIVSIGRFFEVPSGNNKQHLWLIRCFDKLTENLPDSDEWELHLVGSVQHQRYFERVKAEADWRVHFHHDIEREELVQLLGEAQFYWHGAGYGSNAPSGREHFGMAIVEAMAAGAIPIAHNSGGPVEIGALLWDEPDDLIDQTLELINGPDRTEIISRMMQERSRDFSVEAAVRPILDVMEDPIVIAPNPRKSKSFPAVKSKSEIKVGVISDSPRVTTGFGVVSERVVSALVQEGFQVSCLGMYDYDANPRRYRADPIPIWRGCWHCDRSGQNLIEQFLNVEKPDVVYINYDPGTVYNIMHQMEERALNYPIIAYFPVEGAPMLDTYGYMIQAVWLKGGVPITYTKWGVSIIGSQFSSPIQVAPHGTDHAAFAPLAPEDRARFRYAVGFHDKFVVGAVKRNKRVSGIPTLLDAMEILVRAGHEDIVAYIHTNPDEANAIGSYPLRQMVKQRSLEKKVFFPPDLSNQVRGVQYAGPREIEAEEPGTVDEARALNMTALNFIQRLNLLDAYVDTSQTEGWGLPSTEAAVCGVPVICPKDDGVREEVWGDAPLYVPRAGSDYWHMGSLLCHVSAQDVAEAILKLKNDPDLRKEVAERCMERAMSWSWKPLQQMVCRLAEELVNR
jgi:glycosyltransferase involved in cell wall biosynthesis